MCVCVWWSDLGSELPHGSCARHPDVSVVSQTEGHLSSRSVANSGHGSEHCPWVIVVQPGKTVDLYVLDFSLTSRYLDLMTPSDDNDAAKSRRTDDDEYCHVYATLRELPTQGQSQGRVESEADSEVKICAGNRREQRVYSSVSNAVSVRLSRVVLEDQTANFLLKYVGNFVPFSLHFLSHSHTGCLKRRLIAVCIINV